VRLTKANSTKGYIAAVEGRIGALSRAHTLLSESRWQGADLVQLVDEELSPYRTRNDKVVATGAHLSLPPATAQILALVLHELATNAAKYGALSSPTGQVRLSWELQQDSLRLQWTEVGGPPARQPATQGFGTKIISASVGSQLGGRAIFEWRRDGLHCALAIPLYEKAAESPLATRAADHKPTPASASQVLAGNRVLVVEDEALVAMFMRDILGELGFSVVGPYNRLADAAAAVKAKGFDAAVLDINLDGQSVYTIADLLAERGIPFVFVTGYGTESIDARFAAVPVLQKPIERHVLESIFVIEHERGNGAARAVQQPYPPPPDLSHDRPDAATRPS
jgi:two-component sensor histidine kinase/CheY-like chemotaxis protein